MYENKDSLKNFFFLILQRDTWSQQGVFPPETVSVSEGAVLDCSASLCGLRVHEHEEPLK